jgi:hypothetical protein
MAPWTFRKVGMREHEDYQMADDPETAAVLVKQVVK